MPPTPSPRRPAAAQPQRSKTQWTTPASSTGTSSAHFSASLSAAGSTGTNTPSTPVPEPTRHTTQRLAMILTHRHPDGQIHPITRASERSEEPLPNAPGGATGRMTLVAGHAYETGPRTGISIPGRCTAAEQTCPAPTARGRDGLGWSTTCALFGRLMVQQLLLCTTWCPRVRHYSGRSGAPGQSASPAAVTANAQPAAPTPPARVAATAPTAARDDARRPYA
jgi:hypothetical protein